VVTGLTPPRFPAAFPREAGICEPTSHACLRPGCADSCARVQWPLAYRHKPDEGERESGGSGANGATEVVAPILVMPHVMLHPNGDPGDPDFGCRT
jgi:hypothetical protein